MALRLAKRESIMFDAALISEKPIWNSAAITQGFTFFVKFNYSFFFVSPAHFLLRFFITKINI